MTDRHHFSRRRSRSPGSSRRDPKQQKRRSRSPLSNQLPLNARALVKHDLKAFKRLFALYLDIQKQIDIDDLDETEIRGRWKSFLGKWNRGELAEGWYDPVTKEKADRAALEARASRRSASPREQQQSKQQQQQQPTALDQPVSGHDDSEDEYGPSLPTTLSRVGPKVPSMQDLQYRNVAHGLQPTELAEEDETARRQDLTYDRKMDRKLQKERLEELNPRAEPGSRERQLEKKREKAGANRAFREEKSPGAEEVGEGDLIGGEDGIKAHLQVTQRKKSERELRKEEILRAREAEREERLAEHRAKEDKTMDMLRTLARQRYG
ncbi:hypothetical protein AUEXF2481DRAFT_27529 [Aureobasidium subglaciale EXF-2481]|uniref:Uncharacterized protein n=1 Tax=Aureobasidium subglaciale (strain EXF-2481) TaxID=1043005 RepID=A0A074YHS6_AURSE|nr:uncharacterized protein AUEXF2481DRAFT_27529 [Aureobasidium subglaciale EXF-2481]KAI5205957.1 hypothetical protein E4T38_03984 [Aureobasidium subglaciale]KAI5224838.1 hypothetical protein E4T40_03759 [Aureobasidium subglaciale]KAI5227951.1 hypothetical protein E4T41_03979 [Aureobasidium subglaciale]KAI5263500.1 hypothetical protein E4T46_03600 [Aureobasidium subglaciale]KEQ97265.1 hypothetical protein AUEXF2481DRAFT_27529 [Aureobasidium subglaciale EXF-2481]